MTYQRPPVTLDNRIAISDDVLAQELAGETILLDLASEQYYGLDNVGTRIWQLLREHQDLKSILERLCAEYDATADRLEGDMLAFVGSLADGGLVNVLD